MQENSRAAMKPRADSCETGVNDGREVEWSKKKIKQNIAGVLYWASIYMNFKAAFMIRVIVYEWILCLGSWLSSSNFFCFHVCAPN